MRFGASYSTSNKLLLISRHIMTTGLKKMPLKLAVQKFANSLSPPSIVKKVRTGSKSSQGTLAMPGKSQGSQQPRLNRPIVSKQTWSITSTETTRLIRDGEGGYGGGGRGKLYTYRYTVTIRMIPAIRWAGMRDILMFQ